MSQKDKAQQQPQNNKCNENNMRPKCDLESVCLSFVHSKFVVVYSSYLNTV